MRQHHMHKPDHSHKEKIDYAKMAITLDHNFSMAEFVGPENGLQEKDLENLTPRLEEIDQQIKTWRQEGTIGFFDLPYQEETAKKINKLAKKLKEWCWDLLVLGIGGSALGAKALHQALCHPSHNLFPPARRSYHSRLFVADNIDPDYLYGILDAVELRRTVVNVISKSGSTAETIAQFLFVYSLLKGRLGADKVRDRIVLTTDPEKGMLRHLVQNEGFPSLSVPPNVGGRFSVLAAVGLFPAAMVGVDIEELLEGARFMDQRLRSASISQNLAYRLAACYYLFLSQKARPIQVIMPYAAGLTGIADWFCQLWGESLGKKYALDGSIVHVGPTPVRAVGVTDQHSQLQLYMEGPPDKIITFLEVDKFQHTLAIPRLYPEMEGMHYLGGHSFAELLQAEKKATAFNLIKAGRPNLTLHLPEINPFTLGQLIYLFEVTVVVLGRLLNINPFDQPGVEGGKQTTYGLMGRQGFESQRQEVENAPPVLDKYVL
ncbi:glucose-6-phosphate isomerase [Desulfobacca acetoxidans]|uniref:Glucose-6-phosphate isomerase n=1 Tax=Desulfobacca acetoxidans (strain ATCC 700848 / DSM 11109 / ASRB2) TaxID=880072 RepID=F2NEM9_DESAR|nr:glucose-6-phosphate isomerase [Desulfobacca acetoxidans]AEB08219.1 Glucose-6-phosphate isomerase [Desulfobacca acetoxidans DSM 11109]